MKLLTQYLNELNNNTYKLYELKNGIKLLHVQNPATVDCDFSLIFRAGGAFEIKAGVPNGTAHFLEHMLLNPNKEFKNKEQIDTYEMGNREKPSIYMNAFTSKKNIYITGHSNREGLERILKRVSSMLDFPKEIFSKQMEKERGIIVAERSRKNKKEKNSFLQSLEFLFKDITELQGEVLGELEDIKKITIDDLEKYFNERFVTGNTIIALQTEDEISKELDQQLEKLASKIKTGKENLFREYELNNSFGVDIFTDDRATGTFISYIYFVKESKKMDYKEEIIQRAVSSLIDWIGFNILREQMSLVYDFSTFRNLSNTFYYSTNGMKFTTSNENITKILDELYVLLYEYSFKFLDSDKGIEWFDDFLSNHIYPRTTRFNSDTAEQIALGLFECEDLFNENLLVKEAKKLKIEDIKRYLEHLLEIPPHIWIESDQKKEELEKIVKNSKLAKKFRD